MKRKFYYGSAVKIIHLILMTVTGLNAQSQNAVISTPLGIGKRCGGNNTTDSFRVMTYNDLTNSITVSYKCKPALGGGSPVGPAFSSSAGSVAFNPKNQKVYYIATTTGNESFVYSWAPNFCPPPTQVRDYYYPGQFVVGLDFEPATGDGYQLEFTGSVAPYTVNLRKVNFATNYFGPSVPISLTAGAKIYQQRGDIVFTPQGELYFAFDDKMFRIDYTNYGSGTVIGNFIDSLRFGGGYNLTGISYAHGKFIGSTQSGASLCAFKEIDVSTGVAVLNNIAMTNGNFTAIDMATLINGVGVAKKISAVAPWGATKWIVQYDIKIRNFGNSILNNVQLVENLTAVYGGLLTSATVAAVGTLPAGLTLNSAFDGATNTNIFVGGSSSILNTSPADSATVRVTLVLTNPNINTTYYSSSIGSGSDAMFATNVSDSSNNDYGLKSDLNFDGVPDDANEDIPTPLRISDWIVLANKILDFNGTYSNKAVTLKWSMENIEEGLKVNVQRSADGKNFATIAAMPISAPDAKNFNWKDSQPFANANYYRLELVDKKGGITYTSTVVIVIKEQKPVDLQVSPNPFKQQVAFTITLSKPEKLMYRLVDMQSGIVRSEEKTGQPGSNKFYMENLTGIPAGVYLLQVIIGDEVYNKTVIKNN